ncbi:MAG: GGDEF domain-containing protein [Rhodoferax sp.]|nr:GGDEF domain-containing protein [Rhodoferax sp.]
MTSAAPSGHGTVAAMALEGCSVAIEEFRDWKRWLHDIAMVDNDSLGPYRDRIMQSMGVVTLALLMPFTINNFLQGRYQVAVGLILLQAAIAANGYAAWRGRRSPVPPLLLLLTVVAALTSVFIRQGVIGVLWSYPLMVFTYFILRRLTAIAFSAALLIYFPWLTWRYIDSDLASRHLVSLLLVVTLINIVLSVISSLHQTLAKQALTDPLTGCFNRRCMDHELSTLVTKASRYSVTASVLMIDIDHFKEINDSYGHGQGYLVLQGVVEIASARIRVGDHMYRFGGEEFLMLLEQTGMRDAKMVAEDIRARIETAELLPGRTVTVSIGLAQHQAGQSVDAWIKRADRALYRAKQAGRNRVVSADLAGAASDIADVSGPPDNRPTSNV